MDYAHNHRLPGVDLVIDQQKAYDLVYPTYLRFVLLHVGLPTPLVLSLCDYFFSTSISVMVNGFLSAPAQQGCGLRQGDPISPVLFNLAFDPPLRIILNDFQFHGFSLSPSLDFFCTVTSTTINALAYTDDVLFFLTDPNDFHRLQEGLLAPYGHVSNAKVNYHKTEVISLSGASQPE